MKHNPLALKNLLVCSTWASCIAFALLLCNGKLYAAAGDLDLSLDPGSVVDGQILAVVSQPDGKVIIGGEFTTVRGAVRNRIARLNTDGTADLTFNPGVGADATVNALALQSDGKVLVGGNFIALGANSWNFLARLNPDGSGDTSFISGTGIDNYVRAVTLQPDGKILVGGDFTSINGTNRTRIARINANGTLDMTFNPGTGADNGVHAIALQADGKIILGGAFTGMNGTTNRYRIARLNANGSLDATFNPGSGADNVVQAVVAQKDGKIMVGGTFISINGTNKSYLARLNTNGTVDGTFAIGTGPDNYVYALGLQSDGKVVFGGAFTTVSGTSRYYLGRLNTNGSLEDIFNSSAGANQVIRSLSVRGDNSVLAGGDFTAFNGSSRSRLVLLDVDGNLDPNLIPGNGPDNAILAVAPQPDGKVLVGGQFTSINLTGRNRIARLTGSGNVDATFTPGLGANDWVQAVALQTNSMVLLGGKFTTVGATSRKGVARLKPDGTQDLLFNPGTGANAPVNAAALQPDGKLVVGGDFTVINGTNRNHIARLNADGSLDISFNPGTGVDNNSVFCLALQTDGKVVLGGSFTSINSSNRTRIARLAANGAVDGSFNPGSGPNVDVRACVVQGDGQVIIGGWFFRIGTTSRSRIARLNADGTLDMSFNPGADDRVEALALQADGKILLGGLFTSVAGTSRNRIARLNPDGTLDNTFNPGTGASGPIGASVFSIGVQADTKILIGGSFTSVNGVARGYLARLMGDMNTPSSIPLNFQTLNNQLVLSWSSPSFSLQSAPTVTGTYTNVPGASSPYTNPLTPLPKFFRLKSN